MIFKGPFQPQEYGGLRLSGSRPEVMGEIQQMHKPNYLPGLSLLY